MKAKTGKCVIAATLACVSLSSALCLTVGAPHSALAEDGAYDDYNLAACEQRLATIGNEVEGLVASYNEVYETDWAASEIEYSSIVFLVEKEEYAMYLDLDGDNGYVVMTADGGIYGLETHSNLEWLREESDVYYSTVDGFLYVDNDGWYQRYEFDATLDEVEIATVDNSVSSAGGAVYSTMAVNQTGAPDGEIKESAFSSHVNANYSGYSFDRVYSSIVNGTDYGSDDLVSYYRRLYNNGNYAYDNNSTINAMYNILWDWNFRGHIKNIKPEVHNITTSIYGDVFYADYGTETKTGADSNGSYRWIRNDEKQLTYMPVLYSTVRGYAINKGYTPEVELDHTKIPAVMENVANTVYGNSLKVYATKYISDIMCDLDAKRSCVLHISGSSSYGDRSVGVFGVYAYKKEAGVINGHTIYDYKYFYKIGDGINKDFVMFDPNLTNGVSLNFYCINLPRC